MKPDSCYRSYLFCQFKQIVVYAWNKKLKNAVLSSGRTDLQLWILEKSEIHLQNDCSAILHIKSCRQVLVKVFMKKNLSCIIGYLKHRRTESETPQILNCCACVQEECLVFLKDDSKDSGASSFVSLIEPCWASLLNRFLQYIHVSANFVIFSYSWS